MARFLGGGAHGDDVSGGQEAPRRRAAATGRPQRPQLCPCTRGYRRRRAEDDRTTICGCGTSAASGNLLSPLVSSARRMTLRDRESARWPFRALCSSPPRGRTAGWCRCSFAMFVHLESDSSRSRNRPVYGSSTALTRSVPPRRPRTSPLQGHSTPEAADFVAPSFGSTIPLSRLQVTACRRRRPQRTSKSCGTPTATSCRSSTPAPRTLDGLQRRWPTAGCGGQPEAIFTESSTPW
jgi:hypothetical protein